MNKLMNKTQGPTKNMQGLQGTKALAAVKNEVIYLLQDTVRGQCVNKMRKVKNEADMKEGTFFLII